MLTALPERVLSYPTASGCPPVSRPLSFHERPVASGAYRPSPADPNHTTPGRRVRRASAPPVRLHLEPGQKSSRQLAAQYGDRLICVRYRYDAKRRKRLKAVEIIVAERGWEPCRPRPAPNQLVALRVAFDKREVRDQVKRAGGPWSPADRLCSCATTASSSSV